MLTRKHALTTLALLPLLVPSAHAADDQLPIRSITLYRSGVGFFERQGIVDDAATIQLEFDEEQINDILKSMVVLDLDGGNIESVSYGSKQPLARRLASFGVDLSDDPDLTQLISRLRGEKIRVSTIDGNIEGTVLGVEKRWTDVADDEMAEVSFVNLVTTSGIRSVSVRDIRSIELLDPALAAELNKALAALAEQRGERVKSVDVRLTGEGARKVVVAYVHEMPVWKSAYRLVLPEGKTDTANDEAAGEGPGSGSPTIQGWAIVENTTDEDWQDVSLSLVAGRPVSFLMDLYEPLFVERPEIPVPAGAGVAPRVYAGGTQSHFYDTSGMEGRERLRSKAPPAPARRGDQAEMAPALAGADRFEYESDAMVNYAARAQAAAAEVGEVFQYQLKSPVTVERQRSAMIPILSSAIDGRRVSIYNRNDGSEHPMRGIELTNSTDFQLMPGPISVFDGSAYAGDAQIGHVPAGDKRLLSYAVDLDVHTQIKADSTSTIDSIRIAGGSLIFQSTVVNAVNYAFANKDQKRHRTIILEQPRNRGWDLVEPAKAYETTDDLYRFEVSIKPGDSRVFAVKQQQVQRSHQGLVNADIRQLQVYVSQGKASEKVVEAVREAAAKQAKINELERQVRELDQEQSRITSDQNRIRQNMNSIDRQSDLYVRYLTTLNEQEDRLEKIRAERETLAIELEKARKDLDSYLSGLNVG